jgi:hypothetical protein
MNEPRQTPPKPLLESTNKYVAVGVGCYAVFVTLIFLVGLIACMLYVLSLIAG